MIEEDINVRWEKGIPHHPKSIALFESISKIDFELCNDYFCWKHGGDGDNGETLMYELDIHFEREDEKPISDIQIHDPYGLMDKEFRCPECGSHHFGTGGEEGDTGYCHGYGGNCMCGFTWKRSEDSKVFFNK